MSTSREMQQDALAKLEALAKEKGDQFILRISRRSTEVDPTPMPWASFAEATVNQIVHWEPWFNDLVGDGGGCFDFEVFHALEPLRAAAFFPRMIVVKRSAMKEPNTEAIRGKNWQGPSNLTFPHSAPVASGAMFAALGQASAVDAVAGRAAIDATAGKLGSDAALQQARDEAAKNEQRARDLADERHKMELERLQWQHRQELEAAERKRAGDLESADRRRRDEMDQLRRDTDSRFAAIERSKPIETTPKTDILDRLPAIIGMVKEIAVPLLTSLQEQQRSTLAAIEHSNQQNAAMIDKLAEKVSSQKSGPYGEMAQMSDIFAKMAGNQVQLIHHMQEVAAPPGSDAPPAWIEPVNNGIKALQALTSMMISRSERLSRVADQNMKSANATATTVRPQALPEPEAELAEQPTEAPRPPEQEEQGSVLDVLARHLRDHTDPVHLVPFLMAAFDDRNPELVSEMIAVEGKLKVLMINRMTEKWMDDPKNEPYLLKFYRALFEAFKERKIDVAAVEPELVELARRVEAREKAAKNGTTANPAQASP